MVVIRETKKSTIKDDVVAQNDIVIQDDAIMNGGVNLPMKLILVKRSTRPLVLNQKYLSYMLLTDDSEPESYNVACHMDDTSQWELAMQDEMKSFILNKLGN